MGLELNKYSDIRPVITTEAIPEGRFVLITAHSEEHDFGAWTDLVGVKLPDSAAEAATARFVAGFAVDNRQTPIYQPTPSFPFAQRGGFNQASNVPFQATVHLTPPGNKKFGVIPEGVPALAFAQGEYTLYSGGYIPSASFVEGAYVVAANTSDDGADNAGKAKYSASATGAVGTVVKYDSTNQELVVRTFNP